MKDLFCSLALAGLVSISVTSAASSEDTTNVVRLSAPISDNAEQRISYSGKLRMLSQRIPAAACYYNKGIDIEATRTMLEGAPQEFEKILSALEFGDPDLGIIAIETNRKTLSLIHELRAQWEPFKQAVNAISAGTASPADIAFALEQNEVVLEAAATLVPQLVKQYANPNAIPHAQLMLIDVAGRQRMLTQKMLKEACMMGTQADASETAVELETTMSIFDASLEALRFGMPEVGILPPPNDMIADGLEVVLSDWQEVKPLLSKLLDGQDLDTATTAAKFEGLNVTMAHMDNVVGLYADAAGSGS